MSNNNININAPNLGSFDYSDVLRQTIVPVMLDLTDGKFSIQADRLGFKMGFIKASGNDATTLVDDVHEQVVKIRTDAKTAKNTLNRAQKARANATKAAANAVTLKQQQNRNAAQRGKNAKIAANTAAKAAANAAAEQARINQQQQYARTEMSKNQEAIMAKSTANAAVKAAKNKADAAAAAAAALPKQPGFFKRVFGFGSRQRTRRNRH